MTVVLVLVALVGFAVGVWLGAEVGYDQGWHDGRTGKPHRDQP